MNKVVYYSRVSTLELEQINALQEQIKELENFIQEQNEWTLTDKYIDEGKSGTTIKGRNEYNRLYEDLESDKFDIIVIKDETRLNRNVLEWYRFIDRMLKNDKKLYFYMERKFYTTDDTFLIGIKALMANEYSRDLSKKLKNAHMQRKKKGKALINNNMWGYNITNGEIVINDDEAEIIRFIFNEYISGKGFRIIHKELEEKGVKNRNGKPFALTTLKRIIKNEKYKGTLISNKTHKDFDTKKVYSLPEEEWIVHEDAIPAIIDKETWEEANKILKTKKRKNEKAGKEEIRGYFKGNHVYSGKIICNDCGKVYWHTIYRGKSKWLCSEYKMFGTKNKEKKHGCVNYKFSTEMLNCIMQEAIFNYWTNKEEVIKKVLNVLNMVKNNTTDIDNLQKLKNEKLKLENKKNKLIDFLTEDLISKEEYIIQKKKIDYKITNIENEINTEESNQLLIEDNKKRIDKIKHYLDKQITDKTMIDDEIIKWFLDKIIVKSESELDIYLYNNVKTTVKIDSNQVQNVSSFRQN